MSASMFHRTILMTAVAAALGLAAVPSPVSAQDGEQRNERRSARDAFQQRGQSRKRAEKADTQAVAQEYPQATRQEPGLKTSTRIGAQLNTLSEAQQAGDLTAAEAAAAVILENDRANAYERALALRLLADVVMDTDATRAADYMRQALEADGLNNNDHYNTMLGLGQLQLQEEDYTAALATFDRLVAETHSDKPELQVLRGNTLYRLERYNDAIAALEPVVKGNPEARADWTQLLMASYADAGRPDDAKVLAEQVASQAPGDKRAQLNLANVYLQADDYPNAIAVYERLRQAGELSDERDYNNLAALYLNSENGEANAISVLNEGLEKGLLKGDYRTYSSLAQAYYFSDQYEKAIEFYGKAAPLDDDGSTYLNLAKVLSNEGRDAESKSAAQKALDKGLPNPEEARKLLAR
mgnify:CR=1 FL=1